MDCVVDATMGSLNVSNWGMSGQDPQNDVTHVCVVWLAALEKEQAFLAAQLSSAITFIFHSSRESYNRNYDGCADV